MNKLTLKILTNYSPNFSTYRRKIKNIKYLIFHYTGMNSETKAINRLTNDKSKVSCHYFIKRNGLIILMVPEKYEAWHAGRSNWKKDKSLNKSSIGIEISNRGHEFGYQNFPKKQIRALVKLSNFLIKKYNIKKTRILGHSDIAADRKKDPGEKFPWEYLSKNKIGIWHKTSKSMLKKIRNIKVSKKEEVNFYKYLYKIGYVLRIKNLANQKMMVKNFQRHFRQNLINGKIDKECLFIAKKISKFSR